jgi:hypothetical protein
MTYSKDQFYKIGVYENDVNLTDADNRNADDNPNFLWPSKTNLNAATGVTNNISRGYMRMISTAFGADYTYLGKRRLHFQFNPETLSRNVTARNDVQLWMNQDPIQFTQPIPGDANFNFELIFNREQEVASGMYRTNNGTYESGDNNYSVLNNNKEGTIKGEYSPKAVTQIGVLADLQVFDQLIGQGINKQLIDALAKKAEKDIAAYNAQKKIEAKSAGIDVTDTEAVIPGKVEANSGNIDKTLQLGVGNSAFIVSQPIRIVFSSLYMVEGFITSTNVTFDKFNPAMVPVQCRIAVSMQAMYIGFAAKKTFLSDIYADVQQKEYEDTVLPPEAEAELPEIKRIGTKMWDKILAAGEDSGSANKYNANAYARFLSVKARQNGNEITLHVVVKPTPEFKTWASNYKDSGDVTATCEWLVKYHGRTDGTMLPAGTGYDGSKKPIVFADRSQYKLSLTDVGTNKETLEFAFTQPNYAQTSAQVPAKPNAGNWDQDGALAIYESIVNITFKITGGQGAEGDADQMIQGSVKGVFNDTSSDRLPWVTSQFLKIKDTGGKNFPFDKASEQVD